LQAIGVNRKAIVFAIIVPLAIYLGWMLSDPLSFNAVTVVGLLFALLISPVLLRWHQPILVFAWNTSMTIFFLPGNPPFWMAMAAVSMLIIILEAIIEKRIRLQNVRSLTWTLLIFLAIVLITAYVRGGIGLRSMGGAFYGGKKYVFIFGALLGYFALSSRPIPLPRASRAVAMFFLGTLTFAMSNLIYTLGPVFYSLFLIFPADFAITQAESDFDITGMVRLTGVCLAMIGPYYYLMATWGVRGIFNANHPFRLPVLCLIVFGALLGGFRSLLLLFAAIFVLQLWLEKLFNTRLFYGMVLTALLVGTALVPFTHRLPMAVQRTLAVLPIDVDPTVRLDAQASSEWRVEMWRIILPEVENYLWLGKGYVINPTDLYMAQESARRGFLSGYEAFIIAGDYHSGPLSLLINFGIPGTLAFIAFGLAGIRVMYRNFRYGDPALRQVNALLLSCFTAKFILFWLIFGDIGTDLPAFTGLIGFNVALNGGMKERPRSAVKSAIPAGGIATAPVPAPGLGQPAFPRTRG
jgi:hypothetical protein